MLIFGGWLLTLWIAIQVRRSVYLEYPYLKVGVVFWSLALVAVLCLGYAERRRGFWSALFIVPVITGFWTMAAIPNLIPYDTKSSAHIRDIADALNSFEKQNGRFPLGETALPSGILEDPSPYYQNHRQLAFRNKVIPNATGPFISNPGSEPGVVFFAVSADQQEVWLTGTESRFPHPLSGVGEVHFIRFLSADTDTRVLHLDAGQTPASRSK
jgi:hypothetical protein